MSNPISNLQESDSAPAGISTRPSAGKAPVPAWLAIVLTVLLLGVTIYRNAESDRSPDAQDRSDLVEKTESAVRTTKYAFAQVFSEQPMNLSAVTPADAERLELPADLGTAKAKRTGILARLARRAHPRPTGADSTGGSGSSRATAPEPQSPLKRGDAPHSGPNGRYTPPKAARKRSPPPTTQRNEWSDRTIDDAVDSWKQVVSDSKRTAGAWRRLGITLFLFDRPGGMAALRRLAHLKPVPEPAPDNKPLSTARRRLFARLQADQPVSDADELALWEAVYGKRKLTPAEVPALRDRIRRLRLGWFQNIAETQLYYRAGMNDQAKLTSERAHSTADSIVTMGLVQVALVVIGALLLFLLGIVGLVRLTERNSASPQSARPAASVAPELFYAPPGYTPPAYAPPRPPGLPAVPPLPPGVGVPPPAVAVPGYYAPPVPSTAAPVAPTAPPAVAAARQDGSTLPFSYGTYIAAFVIYNAVFMCIGFLFEPLVPLVSRWSEVALLRFEMVIEIVAYVPVAFVALLALKLLGSRELRRPVSWRETFAAVGLRSDSLGKDGLTAVAGFLMTLPVLIAVGIFSEWVFQKFHTPVHPVDSIILRTQDSLVRSCLFVQAVICAPLVEELTFRGMLYRGLRIKWGVPMAIILSSSVFALSHNTLPKGFLPLFTLGAAFAIVSHRNRSLVPGILMHAMNNAFVTWATFVVFSQ